MKFKIQDFRFKILGVTLLLYSATGSAQQPPARDGVRVTPNGTSAIRGVVLAADSGMPAPRVEVSVTVESEREVRGTITDAEGRYAIANLPAGQYTVMAVKPGYVTMAHGQRRPFELPRVVAVTAGETLDHVNIGLLRAAVIVARVTDDTGEPLAGASLSVRQYRFVGDRRMLVSVSPTTSLSDDRGEVRLSGLGPGEYYVRAETLTGPIRTSDGAERFAPTFYPGTASPVEAQRLRVTAGQELHIAFPMVAARIATIRGSVRRSDGSLVTGGTVTLNPAAGELGQPSQSAPVQDGNFILTNVFPGDYRLAVRANSRTTIVAPSGTPGAWTVVSKAATVDRRGSAARAEYGEVRIHVSGEDINGLAVVTDRRGVAVRGRVTFDAGSPPPGLAPRSIQPSVDFTESGGFLGGGVTRDDWTFEMFDVAGTGVIRIQGPVQGWWTKAVLIDGKNVIDTPITFGSSGDLTGVELVLTRTLIGVAGSARDERNNPARDYTAVVFAEDPGRWMLGRGVAVARADEQGRFRVTGLTPGRYLAAAVEFLEFSQERDPAVLERLSERATRITVGDDGIEKLVLTVVRD